VADSSTISVPDSGEVSIPEQSGDLSALGFNETTQPEEKG
jgi:hypothetical protein